MGFFSWKTLDTDRSISNECSVRGVFKVHMLDDKGNIWVEDNYEGYGIFGGKDYYELLAEMNGIASDLEGEEYTNFMRSEGIDLAFKDNPCGEFKIGVLYPNLVEDAEDWEYIEEGNETCEYQGFFYYDEDEDEEDEFLTEDEY